MPESRSTMPSNPTALLQVAAMVLLVAIALPLRLHNLGGFVTLDEVTFWFERSQRFREAIRMGDYAATAISSHPGVTTMWLGAAGLWLRDSVAAAGWLPNPDYATLVLFYRLPAALMHTGAIVLGFVLLQRMLPFAVALLAAVLWATDPFVLAFSRILHVDGLMTSFATLSLLAACIYWQHRPQWGYLLLSAVCAGLAVLSKSPALVLLPIIAGMAILAAPATSTPVRHILTTGAAWGGTFLLTLVLVYPAVWADPLGVYGWLRFGVESEGSVPHMQGNFFLGQVQDTPGILFYPVALALRTTPINLLGLLLLPLVWGRLEPLLGLTPAARRSLLVLVVFILLFTLAMSLFPKKFNRYLVMVFPAVNILAAVALSAAIMWLARLRQPTPPARVLPLGAATIAALALLNAWWWHPYHIAAFNQALGGAPMGARTFVISWGEGMEQVAAWLNQQPEITGVRIASTLRRPLQPYLVYGAQTTAAEQGVLPAQTGYVVIDVAAPQRERLRPPFDAFYGRELPVHTVTIHGVEYAWIYHIPPPVDAPRDDQFGPPDAPLVLRGYSLAHTTSALSVTLQWQLPTPARPQPEPLLFLHLLDAAGNRLAQADVPLLGDSLPLAAWYPRRTYTWTHPLPLPADLPPGSYWLAVGLYDPATFARLPVATPPPPDAPDAGGNALLLPIELDAVSAQESTS